MILLQKPFKDMLSDTLWSVGNISTRNATPGEKPVINSDKVVPHFDVMIVST